MKFEFDIKGLSGILKTLESLPEELVSKRGGPVRMALRTGAKIFQEEEKIRFRSLVDQYGEPDSTGLLEKSIIVKRARMPNLGEKGERVIVTFKRNVYLKSVVKQLKSIGTGVKTDTVTVRKTAHLFEYGSSHQPPRKFIYPTFTSKAGEVVDAIQNDLKRRIDIIVKKLAKQNQGRK